MPGSRKDTSSNERFAKIVKALRSYPGVTPPSDPTESRKKFGSSGLKINGKIFAMISSKGEFVVKLPQQRVDALTASGDGKRFDPGHGRLMKEWLSLETTSEAVWLRLAREAMEFVAKTHGKKA
jgi:TfoX/Sxy family transcriptional regulator of competence genes